MLALKGDEIYQLVLEKLPSDADFLSNLKQLHIKDVAHFKQRIGEVQLKLTSPTLESKEIDCSETPTGNSNMYYPYFFLQKLLFIQLCQIYLGFYSKKILCFQCLLFFVILLKV